MKVVSPVNLFVHLVYAGIIVLFLSLSFAYLLNGKQSTWAAFSLPKVFWLSTLLVIGISLYFKKLMYAFVQEDYKKLRRIGVYILLLASGFIICQWSGWNRLHNTGITLEGTPASGFLYVITGLHVVHVVVGVLLLSVSMRNIIVRTGDAVSRLLYFSDPVRKERLMLLANYWHTIDIIWIYLFFIFLFMHA